MVTDSTGAVKNTYAYDPWGNSLGKTEAVSNPWQFAGGYLDATTGLYKFGTRYYSPTLGRWTQKDPVGGSVGKVGSGNAYVYADNAPVMLTDPSGKGVLDCLFQLASYGAFSISLQELLIGGVSAAVAAIFVGTGFDPFALLAAAIVGAVIIIAGVILLDILIFNAAASTCGWQPIPLP